MIRIATLADKRAVEAEMPVEERWHGAHALRAARRDRRALSRTGRRSPSSCGRGRSDKAVTLDLGGVPGRGDARRQPLPPARRRPGRHRRLRAAERHRGRRRAARRRHRGHRQPGQPAARARAHRRHPARHRRQGGGDAGAVPEDRPRRRRSPRRSRWRPGVETVLQVDLTRYLAPPLSLDRAADPPEAQAGAPGARARLRAAPWRAENGAALDFAETLDDRVCAYFHTGGTTGLPKVAQHRASGILYNGWCGTLLHLHRGGRADVPAAALPRLRRLPDPDVLPDDRGADGDADAAGLSRRGGDGQLLEADRAPQGHLPHHRADRGRGADAAQGRRRRLDAAPRASAARRRCRSSSSTASRRRPASR